LKPRNLFYFRIRGSSLFNRRLKLDMSCWSNTDYFTFLIHLSQYLSIRVALSFTLNRASCVAISPQYAQYFAFPLGLTNGRTAVNTLFVLRSPKMHFQKIDLYPTRCQFCLTRYSIF